MSKRQYGTFSIMAIEKNETGKKKMEILKLAVSRIIDELKEADCEPDMNTIQLIVKEGWIPGDNDLSWYESEEEDYQPVKPFWGMSIGMKFTEQ